MSPNLAPLPDWLWILGGCCERLYMARSTEEHRAAEAILKATFGQAWFPGHSGQALAAAGDMIAGAALAPLSLQQHQGVRVIVPLRAIGRHVCQMTIMRRLARSIMG